MPQSSSAPVLRPSTTSVEPSITTSPQSSTTAASSSSPPSLTQTSSVSTPTSSSSRSITTVAFPPTTTSRTPTPTLARRAATTSSGFTKTVATLPLSVTSYGWAPIALPTGTYDLSAILVPAAAGGAEQVVGSLSGVRVVSGSDNSCLSSSSGVQSSTSGTGSTGTSASQSTAGVAAGADSGSAINDAKESSSNKGSIIGGVVGGVLGFALFALLLYFCIIRPRRRRNANHQSPLRPAATERKLGNWFTRHRLFRAEEKGTRGVGSAFGWDFGTLGSSAGVGSNTSRRGTGDAEYPPAAVSSVSGPISATHVQGFQGYGNPLQRNENSGVLYGQDVASPGRPGVGGMIPPSRPVHPAALFDGGTSYNADKDPEKANPFGRGGIEMVPVLPRNNSGQTIGSGRITTPYSDREFARIAAAEQDHFPEQEILNSASPSAYFDASSFGNDRSGQENAGGMTNNAPSSHGHDNSFSESSHMTGNSHAQLLQGSRSPVSGVLETRRASAVLPDEMMGGVQRRPSAANSISQRRKSGVVGVAGVERSASVRRKPVPVVHTYEEESLGGTGIEGGGQSMKSAEVVGGQGEITADCQGVKQQKSFVLDVARPLSHSSKV
ncbi:hypothetical protein QFC22_005066 [Naganishia vaughanmartiniae]|uniref:Uncharacterized protein n=1 Tax=Naganishia vaughanmartiniae TaxID=1424756 RepID=A0ACC2WWT2_9TREE|nr:hypothetical protein QFC22_005066 [Naganishia vaughanmartiniae]